MAAAQILAVGTTSASSMPDVAVVAGTPLTVGLNATGGGAVPYNAIVRVELKDPNGNYNVVAILSGHHPETVISAPGSYRFTRAAGVSCGVYSG